MNELTKRGTFLNTTVASSSSLYPEEEPQPEEGEPLLIPAHLNNTKMTLWSVLATCIACLGGFLFGKLYASIAVIDSTAKQHM